MVNKILLLITSLVFSVDLTPLNYEEETKQGVVVVEYWATWNTKNMVGVITELESVKIARVNICENADLMVKHDIVVVPTIIFYNKGKEINRLEGDLSFTLKTTKEELQKIVEVYYER